MTLYVDYGNVRHEFPYVTGCDWNNRFEQQKWCERTFGLSHTWHYYGPERVFYFKKEKDMMIFQLRWS